MTQNTIDQLATELVVLKGQIANLTTQKKKIEEALALCAEDDIRAQIGNAPYGVGTATIASEKYKIRYNIPKKVNWSQEMLEGIADELVRRGEEPREYVKVKFDVAENAYKNWPTSLQALFEPARTVEQGAPTITIEEK